MNTSPDRSEPDISLEQAVSQLAEEVKRLRAMQKVPSDSAGFEGGLAAFLDQESFLHFEELLKRALALAEPKTRSARWIDGMAPQQRQMTMVLLEMLTGFFEAYRSMAYRVSDLSRFCAAVQNQMIDLKRLVLEQALKMEDRINLVATKDGEKPPAS